MSGVDELVAFLTRCLDEDERVARAASPSPWEAHPDSDGDCWMSGPSMSGMHTEAYVDAPDAEHIARWDPARVLAEVKAKRDILELHSPVASHYADGRYVRDDTGDPECEYCASLCHSRSGLGCEQPDAPWPCPTVSLLAQPYAGQDGWREDWQLSAPA